MEYTGVKVDRWLLTRTWYELMQRIAGRNANWVEKQLLESAYKKISERVMIMSDEELLTEMNDIIASVDFARINIIGLVPKQGMYRP